MPVLQTIIASTRPGRVGLPVGRWFHSQADRHQGWAAELIDLADVALPLLDEPNHPVMRRYTHEHTKRWSESVDRADAFVFVTPEYNHGMPASLKNAIDFVFHEWGGKPLAFVSYGGVSGGLRAVVQIKQVASAIGLHTIGPAVTIPFIRNQLEGGEFQPTEQNVEAATAVLDELLRQQRALASLR